MSYEYELLWQPIDINGCRIRNRIRLPDGSVHVRGLEPSH